MLVKLRDDLQVEDLAGEFLVCDAARSVVHRVTAVDAPWLADLLSGATVEVDDAAVSELVAADLLEVVTGEAATTSRRKVLAVAGAATAAVGLTSLLLPSAVAAASVAPATSPPPTAPPSTEARPNVPELFVGQGSDGNVPNNRVIINYQQGDTDIEFSYSVTGPITTSPTTGTGLGTIVRSISGWTVGESISIVVTGTNPSIPAITRTLVY